MSKYSIFSGPYFPVFRMNTEIYRVNLRIQSEYGKIRTRKNYLNTFHALKVLVGPSIKTIHGGESWINNLEWIHIHGYMDTYRKNLMKSLYLRIWCQCRIQGLLYSYSHFQFINKKQTRIWDPAKYLLWSFLAKIIKGGKIRKKTLSEMFNRVLITTLKIYRQYKS